MNRFLKLIVAATAAFSAHSAVAQESVGRASLTFGQLNLDSGLQDRQTTSLTGAVSVAPNTELLFDISRQQREEDATYFAAGLSQKFGDTTGRLTFGTSTTNTGILPEFFVEGALTVDSGPEAGTLFTVLASHSRYRNGSDVTRLGGEVVKYYDPNANGGYFITQANAFLSNANPGGNTGWEIGGAVTYVSGQSWTLGASGSLGNSAYEAATRTTVENRFWSIRPFVTYDLGDSTTIVMRGEYVDSDLFKIQGGSIGVNFQF